MTIQIPLSRGMVALVDDEDAELVLAHGKWYAQVGWKTFYAGRNLPRVNGKQGKVWMHTLLTGNPLTDHRNGNGLDNRRANLRSASPGENARNRARRSDNSSGFKGVSWRKDRKSWQAYITTDGRRRHLGCYSTAEDAARAYDEAARELHGEFARTNFPPEGQTA